MYIATLTKDMTASQLYAEIVKGTQENNFPGIVKNNGNICCFRSNKPDSKGNFNAQTKCCLAGMLVTNEFLKSLNTIDEDWTPILRYFPSSVDSFIYDNGPDFLTKPMGSSTLLDALRMTHNSYAQQHPTEWNDSEKKAFLTRILEVFEDYGHTLAL